MLNATLLIQFFDCICAPMSDFILPICIYFFANNIIGITAKDYINKYN
jgi:hypothetical protein